MNNYINSKLICDNLDIDSNGVLTFAGMNTVKLARKYGTPLYLFDEERIRRNCRVFIDAVNNSFGGNARIYYASKAACFKKIYNVIDEEKLYADVVSTGEIRTALAANFPTEKLCFHSNNKTDSDISYAIDNKIGCFVCDNVEEVYAIDRIARGKGVKQDIILRVTPGIDPHTYEAVTTGKVDSKFGSAIETGQAEEITVIALGLEGINLIGFHCHIGSQVFDSDVYLSAAGKMLEFIKLISEKYSFTARFLDLGGGFGIKYVPLQPSSDIPKIISEIADFMRTKCASLGLDMPTVCFEPGRSIVADAGITLYTVGTVKKITGYKNYVSVDGGMADNIRYALYRAPYTLALADNMNLADNMICSVVGRCCESGDIIQNNVMLPDCVRRGDTIACFTTGAYNYSMASNYNRIPRPPIVMISDKKDYVAVRRETIDDLISLDV